MKTFLNWKSTFRNKIQFCQPQDLDFYQIFQAFCCCHVKNYIRQVYVRRVYKRTSILPFSEFLLYEKSLVNPIKKLPQISRSRCLAYILDRGMTRTDWEDTCKLVNEPGNYRLPNYNSLSLQKQTTRPKGRQVSSFFQIKSKLQPLGQVI